MGKPLQMALAIVAVTASVSLAAPAITVSSTAAAGALVLDGEGNASTHVVKLADVSLWTDGPNGLTVSVTSGRLTKDDARTPISFQVVLVPDGAAPPTSDAFATPSGNTYLWATSGPGGVERDLYIRYTPSTLQDPGTYSANVHLSVVEN